MLSERDIELAHPEAFDFVWGNLPAASQADFDRHLLGCRYCRAIIDEYGEIGRIIKLLPPHVEPSADLEDRTVTAMVAVIAEQRGTRDRQSDGEDRLATRVYQIPEQPPSTEPETQPQPRPADQPASAEPKEPPAATLLPVWRRYPRRLAAIIAVAAAIIAAVIVIPLALGRGGPAATVAFNLAPPRGSAQAAASATVVARQDASGSWALTVTVRHLKSFGDSPWYECWYVGTDKAGHQQVASAGTFIVPDSGSHTFSMTTAVDPRVFKTMQIRLEEPSPNGATQGPVVLTGTGKTI